MRRRLIIDDPEAIVSRSQRLSSGTKDPIQPHTGAVLAPTTSVRAHSSHHPARSAPRRPPHPQEYCRVPSSLASRAAPRVLRQAIPAQHGRNPRRPTGNLAQQRIRGHSIRGRLRQHLHKRMNGIAKRARLKRSLRPLKMRCVRLDPRIGAERASLPRKACARIKRQRQSLYDRCLRTPPRQTQPYQKPTPSSVRRDPRRLFQPNRRTERNISPLQATQFSADCLPVS